MKAFTATLVTILSFLLFQQSLVSAHAIPNVRVLKVRDSPSGRCGPQGDGARCDSYGLGNECCSASGWCGDSMDHCGIGCQAGFGVCAIR
ncbi:hypothetical protein BJ508DRAFT_126486 [Ascobolus immersus RN42]|uniref:Chitin-binding type-1 domain-containing protein n=1 Tax=Ascobolus immersus RN42 TaxID=1160509 RepID=A0A3N4I5C7_ASCIM|nr:hypothetical protein BJ508DRAFT_126486 [Ascobolus immersus RN42]